MKRNRIFFIFLFFVPLFLLAVLTAILPARSFSENENRPLAQMPALSWEGIQSGTVQSELADWFSDQVPLRDFWIQTNTTVRKLAGQKEVGGVYLGDDHYYFQRFTDESYSTGRMASVFRMMDAFVQKQDLPAAVMLVPSPDHHWTSQGAYLAYRAYCETLGRTPREYTLEQVSDHFYGTLYSKVLDSAAQPDAVWAIKELPTVTVTYEDGTVADTPYHPERLAQKDQYTYFFGGNYGIVTIQTEAENSGKLLVIKDSFANCFVPYLLRDYSEIVMLDLRYFSGSVEAVIAQHGITEILFLYETSNLLTDTGILRLQK